jgi:hypothetical protein
MGDAVVVSLIESGFAWGATTVTVNWERTLIDRLCMTAADSIGEKSTRHVTRRAFVAGTAASALAMMAHNTFSVGVVPSDELIFSSVIFYVNGSNTAGQ